MFDYAHVINRNLFRKFSLGSLLKKFSKKILTFFLFMQVIQASEASFTVQMPVTGVTVKAFHCDAQAMANVVPNADYRTCVLLCYCIRLLYCECGIGNMITSVLQYYTLYCVHTPAHIHYTAFVFFDAPYNELDCPWEYQLTLIILINILKQVNAVHMGEWQIFVIMHKPRDTHIVMEALETMGYCQLTQIYWYKGKEHQTKTPVSSYTSSVEMGTIGFRPDRSKCKWNMGNDPRNRHNHFEFKGVTKYFKHSDGEVVNPAQKPTALLRWLVGNHLHAGSTVLVIGAGSGADVIGATQSCCNVVTVERCDKQFAKLQTTLVKYSSLSEVQLPEVHEDDEENVSVDGGQSAKDKEGSDDDEEEKTASYCPECKGKLYHSEGSVRNICVECTNPAPLHPNCSQKMEDGSVLCLTCYKKGVEASQISETDEGPQ